MHKDSIFLLLRFLSLPTQITPFPLYPWLQAQVKLPGMLVQVALESQLSVTSHSLSSDIKKIAINDNALVS